MKNRKIFMVVAIILVMAIIISGITIAAVAFGSNVNQKLNQTEPTTEHVEPTTASEIVTEPVVIPPWDESSGVPESVWIFAHENGLSTDLWPEEVLEMLEQYPETEEFVLNYPLLKDKKFDIDISDSGYETEVPLFIQWDQRWGYEPYGDDMIANAGCAPTCLSMVAVHLLKDPSLDPKAMAKFSTDYGYCEPGYGSKWSLIYEGGAMLGLEVYGIDNDEASIEYYLEAGWPIICLVGPGDFTYGGHFIVLTDYVDGKIKINDPNSPSNSQRLWDYSEIEYQLDALWACGA